MGLSQFSVPFILRPQDRGICMYFTASLRMPTMRWSAAWMVSRRRQHPAHRRSSLEAITPNAPITIGLPMALMNQGCERTCASITSGCCRRA